MLLATVLAIVALACTAGSPSAPCDFTPAPTLPAGLTPHSAPATGGEQVHTFGPLTGARNQLTAAGHNLFANWSADGQHIWFASNRTGTPRVWRMNPDGTGQQEIVSTATVQQFLPRPSPDGSKVIFDTSRNRRPEMWIMDSDGSDERCVVVLAQGNRQFDWQPA